MVEESKKKTREPPKGQQRLNVILINVTVRTYDPTDPDLIKLIHLRGLRALQMCLSKHTLCFSTTA